MENIEVKFSSTENITASLGSNEENYVDDVFSMVVENLKEKGTKEKKYREKYLPYALEFLKERERVLMNKSRLGSERLSELGI